MRKTSLLTKWEESWFALYDLFGEKLSMFPVIFHVFKEKSFRKGILLANSCMQASIIHLEKLQQDYLLPDMFKGVDVQMVKPGAKEKCADGFDTKNCFVNKSTSFYYKSHHKSFGSYWMLLWQNSAKILTVLLAPMTTML